MKNQILRRLLMLVVALPGYLLLRFTVWKKQISGVLLITMRHGDRSSHQSRPCSAQ